MLAAQHPQAPLLIAQQRLLRQLQHLAFMPNTHMQAWHDSFQ
jgi:hypothetical protein